MVCLRGASSLRNAAQKTDRIAFIFMILVVATRNFEFSQLCPPLLSLMAPPANCISNQSGEEVPPQHGWHGTASKPPQLQSEKNGCPQSSKWIAEQSPLKASSLSSQSLASCYHSGAASRALSQILHARSPAAAPRPSRATPVFRGIASASGTGVCASRNLLFLSAPTMSHTRAFTTGAAGQTTEADALVKILETPEIFC